MVVLKSFSTFALLLAVSHSANAWCLKMWHDPNYTGASREFHSNTGAENCYNIPSDVANSVQSFRFVPNAVSCSYSMYSRTGCSGDDLGGGSYTENAPNVGPPKIHAQSFRIAGCYGTLPGANCG